MKPKLIVIVGPTASGKSELAVYLAKKFGGEVISADSRQVYRGLNIGTDKITKGEMKRVPHHLLYVASPRRQLSAANFKTLAQKAIQNISARGHIPIIAGGTGFWIDAVVYDYDLPPVPPNIKMRKTLIKKKPEELWKILKKIDAQRAKTIEQKNPRRIIRAIEIAEALGKTPLLKKRKPYDLLWLGTLKSKKELRIRVHKRLLKDLEAGVIKEIKNLKRGGLSWHRFKELGLEYRIISDYLRSKITKEKLIPELERAILDYSRRQMVWFTKNPHIRWVKNKKEAAKLVSLFLKSPYSMLSPVQ